MSSTIRTDRTGASLPLLLIAGLLLALPARAQAQDPPVRDTVPPVRDTVPELPTPPDTAATDSLPTRPLVRFPAMPLSPGVGFAGGEWVWDREALLREAPVSLYDLLERIPGIAALRAGVFGQPEAGAAFGGTVGRVEIEIDGMVLDPLAAASLDMSQIPLGQLREVRVQRRLGLLRIRLFTDYPDIEQPYTRVEAGLGEPTGNLFRGLFLVPYAVVGPLGIAIERLDTDGSGRAEPANIFSGWAKWAWTDDNRGIQLEWLRTTLRRLDGSPWPVDRVRQDLIVRARTGMGTRLFAEVYAGKSRIDETLTATGTDSTPDLQFDRESNQLGARAMVQLPWARVGGTLRYRDASFLPATEALIDADLALGPVRASGEVGYADWRDADATSYASFHAEAGRIFGASAFAEITSGSRGSPVYRDTLPGPIGIDYRNGWRVGVSLELGTRASGSIALIDLEQDRARPFGLPFDRGIRSTPVGPARGIEAYGRLVVLPDLLAVESWITDWSEAAGWVYLPPRAWRTALTLHTLPLPSGNLEILGRLDAAHRSGMLAYTLGEVPEGELQAQPLPAYTVINGYLQIRVIDVRAFIRWEDLLGANPEGLHGRVQRGPRILYGVKWNLWN